MTTKGELEFFASCLPGLEPSLSEELKHLGVRRTRPLASGVSFFAPFDLALRVCLWSRLASRVTLVLARIGAKNAQMLYDQACTLPWASTIRHRATIAVHAQGTNSELRNTAFTALKVKDAIVDSLEAVWGARPVVNTDSPDVSVFVSLRGEKATVSLDLVGESLYHRTYVDPSLTSAFAAAVPIAAGMAGLLSGRAVLDPFCGHGLLLCETALLAADAAVGLSRSSWGFFGLYDFDEDVWDELVKEAEERLDAGLENVRARHRTAKPFVGLVSSQRQRVWLRKQAARAGVADLVEFMLGDAFDPSLQNLLKGKKTRFAIAALLPSSDVSPTAACAQAHYTDCMKVLSVAPEESFAVFAGAEEAIQCVCPQVASTHIEWGTKKTLHWVTSSLVKDVKPEIITIPDSAGGADHALPVLDARSNQFATRLRKNLRERRKWAKQNKITCYRLYDSDLPDYAVAVDVFEGVTLGENAAGSSRSPKPQTYLHIAEYAAPASIDALCAQRRFYDALRIATVVCGTDPACIFSKVRKREKGGAQYARERRKPFAIAVQESGLTFELDLQSYLDTGLFLDHRITRQLMGRLCAGKRFLNLFAYTGSASVYAAAGGARSTVTVDLSQTYLEWARRNMAANGFSGEEHLFEKADVMSWITAARRSGRRFDVVFVDPPTFSNSKSMGKRTWDVQRDHAEMLIGVSRLLSESGVAVFSCNLRSFKPDTETLEKYGVLIEDVTSNTIPHDFERNQKIHHCYLVKRLQN